MDKEQTKVIFKKLSDGSVIAAFPEMPGTMDLKTCMSYMHVGQHSPAGVDFFLSSLLPAKPEEYADLKEELESIGYNLKVCRRFTYTMQQVRIGALLQEE